MAQDSYQIKLTGFSESAEDPTSGLIKTFGISPDKADTLLSKLPAIVKATATRVEALNYLRALRGIGANVVITDTKTRAKVDEDHLRGAHPTPLPVANSSPGTPARSKAPPLNQTIQGVGGTKQTGNQGISAELADPFRVLREPDLLDLDALIAEVEAEKSADEDELPSTEAFAPAWDIADNLFDRPSHHTGAKKLSSDPYGIDMPPPNRELSVGDSGEFLEVERDTDLEIGLTTKPVREPFPLDSPWEDYGRQDKNLSDDSDSQSVADLIRDLYGPDAVSPDKSSEEPEPILDPEMLESSDLNALPMAHTLSTDSQPPMPAPEPAEPSVPPATKPSILPPSSDLPTRDTEQRSTRFQTGEHSGTWGLELDTSSTTSRMPDPPPHLSLIPDFEEKPWAPLMAETERAAQSDNNKAAVRSKISAPHKNVEETKAGRNRMRWLVTAGIGFAAIIGIIVGVLLSGENSELEGPLRHYRDTYLPEFELIGNDDGRLESHGEEIIHEVVRRGNCYGWVVTTRFAEMCDLDLYLSRNGAALAADIPKDNYPVVFHCATGNAELALRVVNASPSSCTYGLSRFVRAMSPAQPLEPYIDLYVAALNAKRPDPYIRTGEIMHGGLEPGQRERREVIIPPETCLTFLGISQQGTDLDASFWLDGQIVSEDNEQNNYPIVGDCAESEQRLGYIEFSMFRGDGEYVWQALEGALISGWQ